MHEVTTFRRDVQTDGRHAVVAFGASLEEDLARRDFTINAIAYHPLREEWRDPFGGEHDLAPAWCARSAIPRRGSGRTTSGSCGPSASPRGSASPSNRDLAGRARGQRGTDAALGGAGARRVVQGPSDGPGPRDAVPPLARVGRSRGLAPGTAKSGRGHHPLGGGRPRRRGTPCCSRSRSLTIQRRCSAASGPPMPRSVAPRRSRRGRPRPAGERRDWRAPLAGGGGPARRTTCSALHRLRHGEDAAVARGGAGIRERGRPAHAGRPGRHRQRSAGARRTAARGHRRRLLAALLERVLDDPAANTRETLLALARELP